MPLAKWSSVFSVGVPELDAQHQKWLDIANSLHEAMSRGQGSEVVGRILREVLDYTKTHFATEEVKMRAAKFPGIAQHKAEHDEFVARVNRLVTAHNAGKGTVTIETMVALRDWLVQHILGTDKQYTPYLLNPDDD